MVKRWGMAVTAVVGLAGTINPPASLAADWSGEMKSALGGTRPEHWREIVDAAIASRLRDPDSRKIEITSLPEAGLVCGTYNAKNGYGGYAGSAPFYATFDASGNFYSLVMLTADDLNSVRTLRSSGGEEFFNYKILYYCGLREFIWNK